MSLHVEQVWGAQSPQNVFFAFDFEQELRNQRPGINYPLGGRFHCMSLPSSFSIFPQDKVSWQEEGDEFQI